MTRRFEYDDIPFYDDEQNRSIYSRSKPQSMDGGDLYHVTVACFPKNPPVSSYQIEEAQKELSRAEKVLENVTGRWNGPELSKYENAKAKLNKLFTGRQRDNSVPEGYLSDYTLEYFRFKVLDQFSEKNVIPYPMISKQSRPAWWNGGEYDNRLIADWRAIYENSFIAPIIVQRDAAVASDDMRWTPLRSQRTLSDKYNIFTGLDRINLSDKKGLKPLSDAGKLLKDLQTIERDLNRDFMDKGRASYEDLDFAATVNATADALEAWLQRLVQISYYRGTYDKKTARFYPPTISGFEEYDDREKVEILEASRENFSRIFDYLYASLFAKYLYEGSNMDKSHGKSVEPLRKRPEYKAPEPGYEPELDAEPEPEYKPQPPTKPLYAPPRPPTPTPRPTPPPAPKKQKLTADDVRKGRQTALRKAEAEYAKMLEDEEREYEKSEQDEYEERLAEYQNSYQRKLAAYEREQAEYEAQAADYHKNFGAARQKQLEDDRREMIRENRLRRYDPLNWSSDRDTSVYQPEMGGDDEYDDHRTQNPPQRHPSFMRRCVVDVAPRVGVGGAFGICTSTMKKAGYYDDEGNLTDKGRTRQRHFSAQKDMREYDEKYERLLAAARKK